MVKGVTAEEKKKKKITVDFNILWDKGREIMKASQGIVTEDHLATEWLQQL